MAPAAVAVAFAFAFAFALMIAAKIVQALQMINECFGVGVMSEPWMAQRRSCTPDGCIDG